MNYQMEKAKNLIIDHISNKMWNSNDINDGVLKIDIDIQEMVSDQDGEREFYIEGTYEVDHIKTTTHQLEPDEYAFSNVACINTSVACHDRDGEEIFCDSFINLKVVNNEF